MHIHFIGVGGTLMGHLAILAKQAGYQVSGSTDGALYPPMDGVLERHGIDVIEGRDAIVGRAAKADLFVLGNAGLKRGHPTVEYLLSQGARFTSGAAWLGQTLLADRWVLAVAGTHGKTTASAMLAWILQQAGMAPGYLVAGVMQDMEEAACLGETPFFVVEADEYDTSFFDRQAKFLHYQPRTLIIGNLEYDHADIYPDLAAIQAQFHQLLRRLPQDGLLVTPSDDANLEAVIAQGFWSERQTFSLLGEGGAAAAGAGDWRAEAAAGGFTLYQKAHPVGRVQWSVRGRHNIKNALAALIAARHVGVPPEQALEALCTFGGVKRRLEEIGHWGQLTLYDDFAHHPTAIKATLDALRWDFPAQRIIAFIDPHSHSMKRGDLVDHFADATKSADLAVWWHHEDVQWSPEKLRAQAPKRIEYTTDLTTLAKRAADWMLGNEGVHLVCMSNHSFGGLVQNIATLCVASATEHS